MAGWEQTLNGYTSLLDQGHPVRAELDALRADAECLRSIVSLMSLAEVDSDGGTYLGIQWWPHTDSPLWELDFKDKDGQATTLPTAVAVLVAKLEATP